MSVFKLSNGINRCFLLFLTLGLSSGVFARTITHEDVWLMKRLGSPVVSPDGKWAVVSVTEPSYEKEEIRKDLWLISTAGDVDPMRLTSTQSGEGGASWSPDSKWLVFSAKRDGDEVSQIYKIRMNGPGEAVRLSNLASGARSPIFSPDGQSIAFQSDVYKGAIDIESNRERAEATKKVKTDVSSYEHFPIRYWDHWLDTDRQTHLWIMNSDGSDPRDLLAEAEIIQSPGFSGVSSSSGQDLQPAFSPNGQSLIFCATINRHLAASETTLYSLYEISLNGGEPAIKLKGDSKYYHPEFVGERLYARSQLINEYAYNRTRLLQIADSGNEKDLTEKWNLSVSGVAISNNRIVVSAHHEGRGKLFELDPTSGNGVRLLTNTSRGVFSGPSISLDGSVLLARWEDGTHPQEIYRISEDGSKQCLTSFNQQRAAGIDWLPYEDFWIETSRGYKLHSWIVKPADFDPGKKYPLVLFIHGGPHSSSMDAGHVRWSPQLLAAGGYVVLLTDYIGSVGYGEGFSRRIQGDPLQTPGLDLLDATDAALAEFNFLDPERVAATGASYGGHLVNWFQATTTRFDCLVGHAGLISLEGQWASSDAIYHREINNSGPPWESPVWRDQSPSTYADSFQTPMLITIGEKDYRVPLNQTIAAWSYLKRMNVPSKLLVFHRANHWIMEGNDAKLFWDETHNFLQQYLK